MSVISQLSIISLKRKAETLSKKLKRGDKSAAVFLISNHPKYQEFQPQELLKLKISNSEVLYAIAKKNGYGNWSELREKRISYIQTLIRKPEWTENEIYFYQHINYAKVFNSVFSGNVIKIIPATYRTAIQDLKHVCGIYWEHYSVVRCPEKKEKIDEKDVSTHYYYFFFSKERMSAEKVVVAMKYLQSQFESILKKKEYEDLGGLYSTIAGICIVENLQTLFEFETDANVKKIIEGIIKERNKPAQKRNCPVCFMPNPPGTTECLGCGLSLI